MLWNNRVPASVDAPSASLLIPYLLQALRACRTARFRKDTFGREGPPRDSQYPAEVEATPRLKDVSNGGTARTQIFLPLDSAQTLEIVNGSIEDLTLVGSYDSVELMFTMSSFPLLQRLDLNVQEMRHTSWRII